MSEGSRSLRFRITLAPRVNAAPPPPATPFVQTPVVPTTSTVPPTYAVAAATAPTVPPALTRPPSNLLPPSPSASRPPFAPTVSPSAATPHFLPPPPPSTGGAAQRYGGLVRISELRERGVDVLLPAMTAGTGGTARRPRVPEPAPPSRQMVDLPAHMSFADIFTSTAAAAAVPPISTRDAFEDLSPQRRARRGAGSGGGGRRGRTRGTSPTASAAPSSSRRSLALQADGSLCAHRWYVKGGRRVLVYDGQTYKGSAAHRLWQQIKRHSAGVAGSGTARSTTRASSSTSRRTRAGASATNTARRPSGRSRTTPATTPTTTITTAAHLIHSPTLLSYPAGGPPTIVPIDMGDDPLDLSLPPQWRDPHGAGVVRAVAGLPAAELAPRRVPRKIMVPPARTHALAGVGGGKGEGQGLAALVSRASDRARTAAAAAAGFGRTPRPATHSPEVVEIGDGEEEGEEDGGRHGPALAGHTGEPRMTVMSSSAAAAGLRGSASASAAAAVGVKRPRPPSPTPSADSSSSEWPSRYFAEDSASTASAETDEGKRAETVAKTAREAPCLGPACKTRPEPVLPRKLLDGGEVVEVDGWLYPAELLPTVLGAGVEPGRATEDSPRVNGAGSAHTATTARDTAFVSGGGGRRETGLTVIGGVTRTTAAATTATLLPAGRHTRAAEMGSALSPLMGRYEEGGLAEMLDGEDMDDMFDRGDEIGGSRL